MNELTRFDLLEGSGRELIDIDELEDARSAGWLIEDPDRRRPRYFDGRFLTAKDLTRDQDYFASRQLDLGLMGDMGVVEGLVLVRGSTSAELVIGPGHGVTPAGDAVVLLDEVTIDVTDVPAIQTLDAIFGLEVRPNAPIRNRSGLFVVALRNVEYTANPVATYPKDLQGERRIEDGEIIEATAITMIPFESVAPSDLDQSGRARLAREIFLRRRTARLPTDALPIGVVSLRRGVVEWVDSYLVRRDASVDDSIGFGLQHRSVREAHLRQYAQQLEEVLQAESGLLAASDYFQALPPFGPLPVAALEVVNSQLVQHFFPAEFNVELTIIPDDELAALQEEAVTLPPIDLRAHAAVLEETSVVVLIPIPRANYAPFVSTLEGRLSRFPAPRATRPRVRRSIVNRMGTLRLRRYLEARQQLVDVNLQPWQDALAQVDGGEGKLYFMRRRRFSQASFSFSRYQAFPPGSPNPTETLNNEVRTRLIAAGELEPDDEDPVTPTPTSRLDFLLRRTTNEVLAAVEALLSKPVFDTTDSPSALPIGELLINGVIAELAYRTRVRLDELITSTEARRSVIDAGGGVIAPEGSAPVRVRALTMRDLESVASVRRYSRPNLGAGFEILLAEAPDLGTEAIAKVIAESFRIPELDATVTTQLGSSEVAEFAQELLLHAQNGDIGAIRDMVDLRFAAPDDDVFGPILDYPGSTTAADFGEGRTYHMVHYHPTATDDFRDRLSAIMDQATHPGYYQSPVASMLLMEVVVAGCHLNMRPGSGEAQLAQTLLDRLRSWDPGEPIDVEDLMDPDEEIDFDPTTNSTLNTALDTYEDLAGLVDVSGLTGILQDGFDPAVRDRYRYLGMAGSSAQLIYHLVTSGDPAPTVALLDATVNSQSEDMLTTLNQIAQGLLP